MATDDSTRLDVDDDEEAIRRFWTANTLKAVAETAIGRALARTNSENGLATKGKA